jgi:hypothetical protein
VQAVQNQTTRAGTTRRSSSRLVQALLDSKLAFTLAILIGQQRNACVFHTDIPHLKLLGSMFDGVQETLQQYVEFLSGNMDSEAYAGITPSVGDLCAKFDLEPEVAWFLSRPRLAFLAKSAHNTTPAKAPNGSVEPMDLGDTDTKPPIMGTDGYELTTSSLNEVLALECVAKANSAVDVWVPGLHGTIEQAMGILPSKVWKEIRYVLLL